MEKEDFLNALSQALRKRFTQDEIHEILSDYEGFFAVGTAEGKPDSQVCHELGAPKTIAKELGAELKRSVWRIGTPGWRIIFSAVIVTVYTLFVLLYDAVDERPIYGGSAAVLLLAGVLLFGVTPSGLPRKANRRAALAHALLLLIVGAIYAWTYFLIRAVENNTVYPDTLGRIVWIFFMASVWGITLLALYAMLRAAFGRLDVILHAVAVIALIGGFISALSNVTEFATFWDEINRTILLYVIQTAVSLLALWIAHRIRRRMTWKRK